MLLETVIGALVPVGIEGMKQLITRFTGGVRATTVAEEIQLQEADIKRLEAIAALDDPHGTPSQWVVDLRASSRYIGALVVIISGITTLYIPNMPKEVVEVALEASGACFGFLFGQRILINRK